MQKIRPFLWFNDEAADAAEFYVTVFKDSKILETQYCGESGPGPKGSVLTVTFEISGQEFVAMNGGPHFEFTPAVSFFVICETQEEVDDYWHKLLDGGTPLQCGWITDRFGVTWQIVPRILSDMLQDKDGARVARVTRAMFQMVKLDMAGLQSAYEE